MPHHLSWVSVEMKRLPISAFHPLLERIRTKLTAWKLRSLSFAGKIIIVQTILQSILVYLLSSGWVPKLILEKIDSFCKFLGSRDGDGHGLVLSAWLGMCTSKENGGLGFRLLKPFQEALMGKQLAKLYDKSPSLWARVIKHKYNPPASIWELQPWQPVSQAWRAVVEGRDIFWWLDWSGRLVMEPQSNSSRIFGPVLPHLIYGLIYRFRMMLMRMNLSRSSSFLQGSGIGGVIKTVGIAVAQAISKSPLPHGQAQDRMRFLGSDLAAYSVNKAYMLLTSTRSSQDTFDQKWM